MGRRTEPPPISWLMKLSLDRPGLISLAAGFTDSESLPVTEARELLEEILASPASGRAALQYGTTAGDPQLRRLTAERLWKLDRAAGREPVPVSDTAAGRGTQGGPSNGSGKAAALPGAYSADRMLITGGSQQLLYLVSECLCDPGDFVLVEDPTYFVYLSIAQSHGVRCRGIRLAADGIDLAHLEQTLETMKRRGDLPRLRFLYLVSYYQNPTGATTSLEKKAGALRLLRRYERHAGHPVYLLEDAAYRELRFAGGAVASALACREAPGRVIYAGTFSKPFATGVRVGYGILPKALFEVALRLKGNHDFGTSNLLQQLVRRALQTCRYEKHVGALRRRYAAKAATLAGAMREHFPSTVEWRDPAGGLYVWARLPRALRSGVGSRLFRSALRHEVLYVPGALCYAPDPGRRRPDHEMRLSFGHAGEAALRTGAARLGATLRGLLRR